MISTGLYDKSLQQYEGFGVNRRDLGGNVALNARSSSAGHGGEPVNKACSHAHTRKTPSM